MLQRALPDGEEASVRALGTEDGEAPEAADPRDRICVAIELGEELRLGEARQALAQQGRDFVLARTLDHEVPHVGGVVLEVLDHRADRVVPAAAREHEVAAHHVAHRAPGLLDGDRLHALTHGLLAQDDHDGLVHAAPSLFGSSSSVA